VHEGLDRIRFAEQNAPGRIEVVKVERHVGRAGGIGLADDEVAILDAGAEVTFAGVQAKAHVHACGVRRLEASLEQAREILEGSLHPLHETRRQRVGQGGDARLDPSAAGNYITAPPQHGASMEHVYEFLVFLAKVATVLGALLILVAFGASLAMRRQASEAGHLEVRRLNDRLRDMRHTLEGAFLPHREFKRRLRGARRAGKEREKRASDAGQRRVFVLTFNGDLVASRIEPLRNEITALLTSARTEDEVVVRIESAGGLVHAYGLGASQLSRIREKGLRLTVAVDKVAASGGYLMASVAHHIVAAPFAIVGSIGVLAQVPNVHRLLKRHDVDVEVLTAGKYKRTLSFVGENTEEGRAKFREELEDVHALFQEFVAVNRPQLVVGDVATGETWYGRRAIDLKLVDELATSDEYLTRACENADVFEVRWIEHKRPIDRFLGRLAARLAEASGNRTPSLRPTVL
jgi:serine protease SohB